MSRTLWMCDNCNHKGWKTLTGMNKHKCKNNKNSKILKRDRTSDKPKKKKISPEMRFKVWEKYVGNKISAKCFCCWCKDITPFTSYNTFHGGHIVAEFNGGEIKIDNLLPICKPCNSAMGTLHWDDFISINKYPLRLYGENIPEKTINKIKHIQLWWRNLKTKKREIIKKKKALRKYLKGYEMTTYTFMKKRRKKVKEKRKLIWR